MVLDVNQERQKKQRLMQRLREQNIPSKLHEVRLADLPNVPMKTQKWVAQWAASIVYRKKTKLGVLAVGSRRRVHVAAAHIARFLTVHNNVCRWTDALALQEALNDRRVEYKTNYSLAAYVEDVPVLLMVDFGYEPDNPRWPGQLSTLLSRRFDANRHTLFTSLMAPGEIRERYGKAIATLCSEEFHALNLGGEDNTE